MSSSLFPLWQDPGGPRPTVKVGDGLRPAASSGQPQSTGAWKREMEQAQRDSWFKPGQAAPGAEGRPESAAGQSRPDSGRLPSVLPHNAVRTGGRMVEPAPAVQGAISNRSPAMPAPALFSTGPSGLEAGRPADIRLASLALALAGVSRLKVTGLKPPADPGDMTADALHAPAGLALRDKIASPEPQAIRLHAEWQGQDVTVWLGIDAGAESESESLQLMQLLPQIRACLQEQRSRLFKLVCNGKAVFEVSSSPVSTFSYFTPPKEPS